MNAMQIYGNVDVVTCPHCRHEYRRLEAACPEQTEIKMSQRDICPHCRKLNVASETTIFMNIPLKSEVRR